MKFIPFPSRKERYRGYISSLHFGPDNQTLAAVERTNSWGVNLSWWDLENQTEIILDPKDSDVACGVEEDAGYAPDPVLSLDQRFLAYVYVERGPEYSLRFMDRKAPKRSAKDEKKLTALESLNPSGGTYEALQFSPDGQYLVAALGFGNEEVDDFFEDFEEYEEESEESEEIHPSGIYRWKVDNILKGLGRKTEKHLLPGSEVLSIPHPLFLGEDITMGWNMVFSPDGSILAAGLWGDRILCWEFPSGKTLPELRIKSPRNVVPLRMAFSPDSKMFAVATEVVTIYKIRSMSPIVTISPSKAKTKKLPRISGIAYHPSQPLLATVNNDSLVRFWDGETGAEKETFDWKIGKVSAVAFSQDGCLCAAAGEKGIAIWDVTQ